MQFVYQHRDDGVSKQFKEMLTLETKASEEVWREELELETQGTIETMEEESLVNIY